MFWNPFKKKRDPTRNRIDDLANSLGQKGRSDKLEATLRNTNIEDLSEKEIESWHHVYGICAFQRGDHEQAMLRFKQGLETCPESHPIRFSLGQEYMFLGQSAKAFSLFDECVFPQLPSDHVMAMSRYAYLFSEYERGIKYLDEFFRIFLELQILDDNYLFMRGLPFFNRVWSNLAAHCVLSENTDHLKVVTNAVKRNCRDFDIEFLSYELAAIITNSFTELIWPLQKRRDESSKFLGPDGYFNTSISVFQSFDAKTYNEAASILSSVRLSRDDFPWLQDVLTLAKAKAANKYGRRDQEELSVGRFLEKQPLLFEPEHAVSFGLLDYQEILKPRTAVVKASL